MHRFRSIALGLVATAVLVTAGCSHSGTQWQLADVSGHLPDLQFSLTDDNGKATTAADYAGKINLLYFGYTHCPDVCPLALTHLHVALQRLGAQGDRVHVLFVTVDPARDTPALLHQYVRAFDPRITGLTGTPQQIKALAKRYRGAFNREATNSDGSYEVSHSSGVYVFDADGRARLLATSADSVDAIVHDLHALLETST